MTARGIATARVRKEGVGLLGLSLFAAGGGATAEVAGVENSRRKCNLVKFVTKLFLC